jgi:hypothetical protein
MEGGTILDGYGGAAYCDGDGCASLVVHSDSDLGSKNLRLGIKLISHVHGPCATLVAEEFLFSSPFCNALLPYHSHGSTHNGARDQAKKAQARRREL